MFSIYTHFSIWIRNQGEGLIKPPVRKRKNNVYLVAFNKSNVEPVAEATLNFLRLPVVAFSMKQGFSVAVQRIGLVRIVTLWLVVERQEEGSRLDGIQGRFVHSLAKVFNPSLCPWNPRSGCLYLYLFPMWLHREASMCEYTVYTCFLQSGLLVSVLPAPVLTCH